MDIIISVILAALLVFVTLKKRAFTPAAAISAGAILVTAAFCGSYAAIAIVLAAYGTVFAIDLVLGKLDKIVGVIGKLSVDLWGKAMRQLRAKQACANFRFGDHHSTSRYVPR